MNKSLSSLEAHVNTSIIIKRNGAPCGVIGLLVADRCGGSIH